MFQIVNIWTYKSCHIEDCHSTSSGWGTFICCICETTSDRLLVQLMTCRVWTTGESLTVVWCRNRLQGTDAIFDGLLQVFSSQRNPVFTSIMQMVGNEWHCVGECCVYMNVAHCAGGVIVWVGICTGHLTQLQIIQRNIKAVWYRDEVPLVLQHKVNC